MNEDSIYRKLTTTKIDTLQLDPFGFCNNACWFCPRGHIPNPGVYKRHMRLDLMEHILKQFVDAKGSICANHFRHIYTGHYNEILLYAHFDGFLDLLKKYDLCTTILTNGLNYTDANIDRICGAIEDGTVVGICMNIPAGKPDAYKRYTGSDNFDHMVLGVRKLIEKLPKRILRHKGVSIVVNGVDDYSSCQRDLLGPNAPHIPPNDLAIQADQISTLFPQVHVYKVGNLVDRGGHLSKFGVFNHTSLFTKMDEYVAGCANCGDIGGRPFAWAHVNSLGELFLCCNDYLFEYTFGSMAATTLAKIWYSKEHVMVLIKAFDGICRTCCSAVNTSFD